MKSSKKIMLAAAVLLLAAALFVGAGAAADVADTNVAKIGETGYPTLAAAIEAVQSGETITMIADVPKAAGISVPSGKNFTVDFADHTYSVECPGAGSAGTQTQAFQLLKDSTITFKNGTINCTEENKGKTWSQTDTSKGIAMIIQNYCNLTLENMTIDGTNIAHNGDNVRYVLSNNCGTVLIKDTTITAIGNDFAFDVCGSGSYAKPNVTVNGNCVITGKIEETLSSGGTGTGSLTINGGSFSDPTALNYLGTNAKVNVTLTGDVETSGWFLGADKNVNVVVDLASHKWTIGDPTVGSHGTETQALHLEKNNTVTIKNGTIFGKENIASLKMLIQNYCNLTLDGVTVDGINLNGEKRYVMSNNCGNVVIKGTTTFTTKDGDFAFDVCKFQTYPVPTVTVEDTVTADKIEVTGGNLVVSGDLTSKHIDVKSGKLTVEQGGSLTISTLDTLVIMNGASVEITGDFEVEEDGSGSVLGVELQSGAQMTLPAGANLANYAKFIKSAAAGAEIITPSGVSGGTSTIMSFNSAYTGDPAKTSEEAVAAIKAVSTIIDGKTTTVTMKNDNTYTFSIPESIELTKSGTVTTEEIYITNEMAEPGVLKLVLDTNAKDSSNLTTFVLNGINAATAEYKIKNGSAYIEGKQTTSKKNVVLTLPMTTAQGKASTTLDFEQNGGNLIAAGQYTGTLTFTIKVDTTA